MFGSFFDSKHMVGDSKDSCLVVSRHNAGVNARLEKFVIGLLNFGTEGIVQVESCSEDKIALKANTVFFFIEVFLFFLESFEILK